MMTIAIKEQSLHAPITFYVYMKPTETIRDLTTKIKHTLNEIEECTCILIHTLFLPFPNRLTPISPNNARQLQYLGLFGSYHEIVVHWYWRTRFKSDLSALERRFAFPSSLD